jgi:hypothetical protein
MQLRGPLFPAFLPSEGEKKRRTQERRSRNCDRSNARKSSLSHWKRVRSGEGFLSCIVPASSFASVGTNRGCGRDLSRCAHGRTFSLPHSALNYFDRKRIAGNVTVFAPWTPLRLYADSYGASEIAEQTPNFRRMSSSAGTRGDLAGKCPWVISARASCNLPLRRRLSVLSARAFS